MKSRDIPNNLKIRQDETRKNTTLKIQRTIDELRIEGYDNRSINLKLLSERTGLHRSTLNKPHAKQLLMDNAVGPYFERKKVCTNSPDRDIIIRLEDNLLKANMRIASLEKELEKLRDQKERLQKDLSDSVEECQLLRGKLHIAIQKARIHGLIFEID